MDSQLHFLSVDSRTAELHRRAENWRRVGQHPNASAPTSIVIRPTAPADADDLLRLSQLEGRRVPEGPTLVAVVEGELLAALPLGDGRSLAQPLADPFRPTAMLVDLLWLRAAHLRGHPAPPRRRRPQIGTWIRSLFRRPLGAGATTSVPFHAPAPPGNGRFLIR